MGIHRSNKRSAAAATEADEVLANLPTAEDVERMQKESPANRANEEPGGEAGRCSHCGAKRERGSYIAPEILSYGLTEYLDNLSSSELHRVAKLKAALNETGDDRWSDEKNGELYALAMTLANASDVVTHSPKLGWRGSVYDPIKEELDKSLERSRIKALGGMEGITEWNRRWEELERKAEDRLARLCAPISGRTPRWVSGQTPEERYANQRNKVLMLRRMFTRLETLLEQQKRLHGRVRDLDVDEVLAGGGFEHPTLQDALRRLIPAVLHEGLAGKNYYTAPRSLASDVIYCLALAEPNSCFLGLSKLPKQTFLEITGQSKPSGQRRTHQTKI